MKPGETFVRYFVPNKGNKYRPLFLRVEIASVVGVIIVVLFAFSVAMQHLLVASNSPQVAAVIASALVDFVNSDRAQNNLFPLTVNPQLQAAAQAKANDMAGGEYFAHVSPTGRDPWYWFTQAGYNFSYGGENLAVYFSDSSAVNTAWMNSPEHRANILNSHFTEIGIATAQGVYQGQETTFVVQEFGTPATVVTPIEQVGAVVSVVPSVPATAVAKTAPKVEGAAIAKPNVKVLAQDKNFIAVQNENVPPPTLAQIQASATSAPKPNPISVFFLKFVTSPEGDLFIAYGIIAAITVLALVFEIGIAVRRPHPHRVVLGFSLIGLTVLLLFVGHTFVFGHLLIV